MTKPTNAAADAPSQKSTTSGEADFKEENKLVDENGYPQAAKEDEPIYFDTTVAKLVKRENADGDEEWVEVLSDNLYPGEKLKRADDDEKATKKLRAAKDNAVEGAEERKDEVKNKASK